MTTTPTVAAPAAPSRRAPATGPALRLGGRRYPVLLPKLRDPRLHVAAVISTVQVLGQTVLGFDVSVAQILISLATAAVLDVAIVASTRQVIAWPASALLTGNGVALLLRTPGTTHGDWWSTEGWPIFVAAAGISVLSKYAIRAGGRHVFNPSNFGLVVMFLAFGSDRADPQDLWWGPWSPALATTLAVIVGGGIALSFRLRLFSVAATFWATFAAAIAVLAASGHTITARWHLGPLAGWDYWWILVSSPEIVIFVFFMITDPRTAPEQRWARPVYAAAVGLLAGLLAGLQTTEFATKVSLLAALTIVCAVRPALDRRPATGRLPAQARWVGGVALAAGFASVAIAGQVTAARQGAIGEDVVTAAVAGERPAVTLADGALPTPTVSPALDEIVGAVTPGDAERIVRDVVEGFAIEADALIAGDPRLAATAAFGRHLTVLEGAMASAASSGQIEIRRHDLASAEVVLLQDPVSPQAIPQLGLRTTGTVTALVLDATDPTRVLDQRRIEADQLLLVTELGGRFLVGEVLPADSPMLVGG